MNEEIKEEIDKILDLLKDETKDTRNIQVITRCEINQLLNYITNLQEENKEINRVIELYGKSLYNADLTRYKEENQKLNKIIDELEKEMNRDDLSYIETQFVIDKLIELKNEVE